MGSQRVEHDWATFTSLHSTQRVSPTAWLLQQPLGSRRSAFAQDTSVPAPLTCDRSLVNGDPRNLAAGSITGSFAQTLGILAKHPLFTWDILDHVHVSTSHQPPFSVVIKLPFLLEQFWHCLESSLPFLRLLFLFIKRMYGRLNHTTTLSYEWIWHSILLKFGLCFLRPLPFLTVYFSKTGSWCSLGNCVLQRNGTDCWGQVSEYLESINQQTVLRYGRQDV